MYKILIILLFSYSLQVYADSVSYTFTQGDNNLQGHSLYYKVKGDGSYKGISFAKFSDDYIDSTTLSLKYGFDLNDLAVIHLAGIYSNENDINGVGGRLGVDYEYSWSEKQITSFWSELEYVIYFEQESVTTTSSRRSSSITSSVAINTFSQSTLSGGLDHSFADIVMIGGSYTFYNYSNDEVSKLDDGDSSVDSVSSYLKHSYSYFVSLIYFSWINVEYSYSENVGHDSSNDSTTDRFTLSVYPSTNWVIDTFYAKRTTDGIDDKSYGIGVTFYF